MKKPNPAFHAAAYIDIQRHWRRLKPLYYSEQARRIWKPCMLEYVESRAAENSYNITQSNWKRYEGHDKPEQFDSCDWRWCYGRKGPCPAFWDFVCHSACHWLVDLGMFVATSAWPNQSWRILTARKHSTIWNCDYRNPLLFDANFLALDVKSEEALRMAWAGRQLKVHGYLKGYLHQYEKTNANYSLVS